MAYEQSESWSEAGYPVFKISQRYYNAQPGLRTPGINTLALPTMLTYGNIG